MLVEKFKSLGDETRILIVKSLLNGPKTVSEIVPLTKKSQPNVSIALKTLTHAGIISYSKDGKFIRYSLKDPKMIKEVFKLLNNG